MTTISEKLLNLNDAKQSIKEAIKNKGADLTNIPFTQYGEVINSLDTKENLDDVLNEQDVAVTELEDVTDGMPTESPTCTDVTDTTATASDVMSGKIFYDADGNRTEGTGSMAPGQILKVIESPFESPSYITQFCSSDGILMFHGNGTNTKDRDIYVYDDKENSIENATMEFELPEKFGYKHIYETGDGIIFATLTHYNNSQSKSPANCEFPIVLKYNKETMKFEIVLTYTMESEMTWNSNCVPKFIEYNGDIYLSFKYGSYSSNVWGGFYYFNRSENKFIRIDDPTIDKQWAQDFKIHEIENDILVTALYRRVYRFDPVNKILTEMSTPQLDSSNGGNYDLSNVYKMFDYLVLVYRYGIIKYDYNTKEMSTLVVRNIENTGCYVYKDNHFLYTGGPNMSGMLLVDPRDNTCKQVIPNRPDSTTPGAAHWSKFIEMDNDLFVYAARTYSPNTFICKWNDEEKMFERVSDVLGYNYVVRVGNNNMYMRCKNPINTDDKYNIYKYNKETQYFDAIVCVGKTTNDFEIINVGDISILTEAGSQYFYIMDENGLFSEPLKASVSITIASYTQYNNDDGIITRLIDEENQIYLLYLTYKGTDTGMYVVDVINRTITGAFGSNSATYVHKYTKVEEIDNKLYIINAKVDSNAYNFIEYDSSKKYFVKKLTTSSYYPIKIKHNEQYGYEILGSSIYSNIKHTDGNYIFLQGKSQIGTSIQLDKDTSFYGAGNICYELRKDGRLRLVEYINSNSFNSIPAKIDQYSIITYYTSNPSKQHFIIFKEYEEEVTNGE